MTMKQAKQAILAALTKQVGFMVVLGEEHTGWVVGVKLGKITVQQAVEQITKGSTTRS